MDNDRQFVSHLLGQAVIDVCGGLPQDIQQKLFEQAVLVGPGNEENLRERLARFLHHHHQRTAAATATK